MSFKHLTIQNHQRRLSRTTYLLISTEIRFYIKTSIQCKEHCLEKVLYKVIIGSTIYYTANQFWEFYCTSKVTFSESIAGQC